MTTPTPGAAQIQAWITQYASLYGVDPNLALALARQESGPWWNSASGIPTSSAGAIGVMQLLPSTAAQLGVNPSDPQQNIQGGIMYLAGLLEEFGDTVEAVAAYNAGPGAVSNLVTDYGPTWLSMAPAQTQGYVQNILGVSASSYQQVAATPTPVPPAPDQSDTTDTELEPIAIATPAAVDFGEILPWVAVLGGAAALWAFAQ